MSLSADFAVATCANVTSSPSYLPRNLSFSYLPTASSFPAPSPHLHSPACLQHPHLLPAIRQAISDYRNSLKKSKATYGFRPVCSLASVFVVSPSVRLFLPQCSTRTHECQAVSAQQEEERRPLRQGSAPTSVSSKSAIGAHCSPLSSAVRSSIPRLR